MTYSGRFLGIDYGTKRVGLAVSDENGKLAFPYTILPNDPKLLKNLEEILKKENIIEIVVGESLDFSGKPNKVEKETNAFISKLENIFAFPINREREFLTSVEARSSKNTKQNLHASASHTRIKVAQSALVDASAAALILQRYLDRKNL